MGPPYRKAKIPIQRAETRHRKTRLAAQFHRMLVTPVSSDTVYCFARKLCDYLKGKLRFQFTSKLKSATEWQG